MAYWKCSNNHWCLLMRIRVMTEWWQYRNDDKYYGLDLRAGKKHNSLQTTPGQSLISLLWLLSGTTRRRSFGEDRGEKKSKRGTVKTQQTVGLKLRTFRLKHKYSHDINHHFAPFQASSLNFRPSTIWYWDSVKPRQESSLTFQNHHSVSQW